MGHDLPKLRLSFSWYKFTEQYRLAAGLEETHYETYLTAVSLNLRKLLEQEKATTAVISNENPMHKTGVAKLLLGATTEGQTIGIQYHSRILKAQANFHNSTIELIRKELVSTAVAVSNFAEANYLFYDGDGNITIAERTKIQRRSRAQNAIDFG